MTIYYNNGETEKQIKGVINIEVIDGEHPVIALLDNGRELTIRLDNIESIYDDDVLTEKGKKQND